MALHIATMGAKLEELAAEFSRLRSEFIQSADDENAEARRSCADKKRYPTPEKAGAAAKRNYTGDELRIYVCDRCGGYHLTKSPLEERAGVAS